MTVRTRFAPSPTGFLHIGGLRTALFCWLYARRHAGQFVLRIEDTDLKGAPPPKPFSKYWTAPRVGRTRLRRRPLFQTKRFGRYKDVIEEMLAAGNAYRCYCSREEARANARPAGCAGREAPLRRTLAGPGQRLAPGGVASVVRFKNPLAGEVVVDDVVHGRVVFKNSELDDLIIARSDGTPTYNFCVVVDDMDMQITHVIRGDDHLNNTPRQLNMLLALGQRPPVYAHLPMILGPDGAKLSKRHGAVSVLQYRDEGFLPEAVLNYLVRLGWSHGDQEIFSIEDMTRLFDIADVNKSASAFNVEKLNWLNQQHLMRSPADRIVPVLRWHLDREGIQTTNDAQLEQIVVSQRERAKTVREMALNSVFFFERRPPMTRKPCANTCRPTCWPCSRTLRTSSARWSLGPRRPSTRSSAVSRRQRASRSASSRSPFAWRCAEGPCRRPSMPLWPFWANPSLCRVCAKPWRPGARSPFIFLTNCPPSGNVPRLHVGP